MNHELSAEAEKVTEEFTAIVKSWGVETSDRDFHHIVAGAMAVEIASLKSRLKASQSAYAERVASL